MTTSRDPWTARSTPFSSLRAATAWSATVSGSEVPGSSYATSRWSPPMRRTRSTISAIACESSTRIGAAVGLAMGGRLGRAGVSGASPGNGSRVADTQLRPARLRLPGTILGVGLGGFVDGILLHQILQWHHMLTSTDTDNIGVTYYPRDTVH